MSFKKESLKPEVERFKKNVEKNPRYLSRLQSHMRMLEATADFGLKKLESVLEEMKEHGLKEQDEYIQGKFADILYQLQDERLGEEIVWIYLAEEVLQDSDKVLGWLEGQEYSVDPIYPVSENLTDPIRVESVYNALAEYEATLDRGRFFLNQLKYKKTKGQLEWVTKRKLSPPQDAKSPKQAQAARTKSRDKKLGFLP